MPRKNHRSNDIRKLNENTDEQLKNPLFSETHAKSVEVSDYTLDYGAPQIDESVEEHTISTGVGKFYMISLYLYIYINS